MSYFTNFYINILDELIMSVEDYIIILSYGDKQHKASTDFKGIWKPVGQSCND